MLLRTQHPAPLQRRLRQPSAARAALKPAALWVDAGAAAARRFVAARRGQRLIWPLFRHPFSPRAALTNPTCSRHALNSVRACSTARQTLTQHAPQHTRPRTLITPTASPPFFHQILAAA